MKIDAQAEILGRAFVSACIARDRARVLAAIDAILAAPEEASQHVLPLYTAVARVALFAIYQGTFPTQEQNLSFAGTVARSETWSPLNETSVYGVLENLSTDARTVLPPEEAALTLFVTLGYILAIYCEPLGYATTYEYLDACLSAVEEA